MTSLERVLTTLGHQEPDRVPFFLLLTLHGAKELGLSIETYFSKPKHVVEGQLRLRAKYRHDAIYNFYYAPVEVEAWGAEVIYVDDGPPNSGAPFITDPRQIDSLDVPEVHLTPCLQKVLRSAEALNENIGDEAPIIGVVMSPFSLPVMQMGFEAYIQLIYEDPKRFQRLMKINEAFCVAWANAQLQAGSTAICYFDPVSSSTIIPRDLYLKTGFEVAKRTIPKINGPTATHMASGRVLSILSDIAQTGTAMVGVSAEEDLSRLKTAASHKIALFGNLNGIEMCRWDTKTAENKVKEAIAQAGNGGGFILSDNHGEIPFQVTDDVLMAISEAVHRWGAYPLNHHTGH